MQEIFSTMSEDRDRGVPDECLVDGVDDDNSVILNGVDPDKLEELVANIFVSVSCVSRPTGVSAEHLAKVWRINLKDAQRTIDVTMQHLRRSDDPELSRNYPTDDRMIRYRSVVQYFYIDAFFATNKAGETRRGFTCIQLYVSDTGYVFVVPMKTKSDVPRAMKMFAKDIGAPFVTLPVSTHPKKSVTSVLRLARQFVFWEKAHLGPTKLSCTSACSI